MTSHKTRGERLVRDRNALAVLHRPVLEVEYLHGPRVRVLLRAALGLAEPAQYVHLGLVAADGEVAPGHLELRPHGFDLFQLGVEPLRAICVFVQKTHKMCLQAAWQAVRFLKCVIS